MPQRCTNCLRLVNPSDVELCKAQCDNPLLCEFEKVETVHYLTSEGFGKVLCKKENREGTFELLKLGCESKTPQPLATTVLSAVTCLTCRLNFPEPVTEPSEE